MNIAIDDYKKILLIKYFEEKIVKEYDNNEIKTPVHLSVGQEGIAVGVCSNLRKKDKIASTHRSHAHYIAKNGDMQALVNELYGKKSGCAGARGGSMHLIDNEYGILGSTSIVGGSIPIATGSAFSQKVKETDDITVCFFGDGAAEEGVFHECLNFAALHSLPIVYVCENNNYAVFTPEKQRKNLLNIYQWGEKFGIEGFQVNGNNIFDIKKISEFAINKARNKGGPTLIEAKTCLKYGHVGNKTDYHLGHKNLDWYNEKMTNSAISLLREKLIQDNILSIQENEKLEKEMQSKIDLIFSKAKLEADVQPESLYNNLYQKEEKTCLGQI